MAALVATLNEPGAMASDPQSSVIALSDDDSDFEQEPLAQPAPRRLRVSCLFISARPEEPKVQGYLSTEGSRLFKLQAGPSRQRSSSQPSTSATASRPSMFLLFKKLHQSTLLHAWQVVKNVMETQRREDVWRSTCCPRLLRFDLVAEGKGHASR